MSLFKKIFKGVKKVAKVGLKAVAMTNPYAAAASTLIGATSGSARMSMASPAALTMSQTYGGNQPMSLVGLPTLGRAAGTLARRAGGAVRRNAGTIGTVATAGAILYDAAGNPVARRRKPRSKGITARELKSFTRVTGILNKYCKTPPPMKRRGASKGRSCR